MSETQTTFDFPDLNAWPPLWARLPESMEAIERGERLAPIPPRPPTLVAMIRARRATSTAEADA